MQIRINERIYRIQLRIVVINRISAMIEHNHRNTKSRSSVQLRMICFLYGLPLLPEVRKKQVTLFHIHS